MSFLSELNPAQRKAVEAVQGPVMVIAGPGSGKTRVLTYRIAHLVSIGVPPYQILALTFTNKAANEMKERIVGLIGKESGQLWMGTFHSIFARILRRECEKLDFKKNFSIYDTSDSLGLIKNIMGSLEIPLQQFNPQGVRARISGAKNQLISPSMFAGRPIDLFEEKTSKIYIEYQKRLKYNNAMDFDDLLLKPIELFERHKKTLDTYQDRFRFILIDEYQDTNRAQYTLIKHFASKYRNICVVGDDAQSIYAFRGADIRNILDFERDYPEATIVRLEQNYRSTKTILAAADQIIKNNNDQITKNLWTENAEGDLITILSCYDDKDEGSTIASRILSESQRLRIDFKDFAVMYRTNAQSRSLEDALRREAIPYVIVGGTEFYQRKEVKDCLAYFRLLVNPEDDESFLRIINYPARGVGDSAQERLKEYARTYSLHLLDTTLQWAHIPDISPKAKERLGAFAELIQTYRQFLKTMSLSELSRTLIDQLGILTAFKEEGTPESLARWENVQELLSAISEFSAEHPDGTLESFLQEVSLVSDVDNLDDDRNAVTLMTLHSAKGLEFPVVFIAGLEEGLLPFYSTSLDVKELEEERRLYYVGITRAMKKLYLSCTRMRYRFGEVSYPSPSRFIEEANQELFERVSDNQLPYRQMPKSRRSPMGRTSSQYFIDEIPDDETEAKMIHDFHVGKIVEHEVFGRGKILTLSGSGEMKKAVVEFAEAGRKNLLLKYARLKIL